MNSRARFSNEWRTSPFVCHFLHIVLFAQELFSPVVTAGAGRDKIIGLITPQQFACLRVQDEECVVKGAGEDHAVS